MINFTLFGIRIQVQPFFWLIMAFLGGGLSLLSSPTPALLVRVVLFMVAGFLSVLVHELGHALFMKKYGRHPYIILHGMGGVAVSSGLPLSKGKDILVSVMGPVAQLLLALLAFIILKAIPEFPTPQSEQFFSFLFIISLVWALLNLIPMFPMDGGQILAAIVGPKHRKIVYMVGIGIGIALIAFLLSTGSRSTWNFMIIGLLIWQNVKGLKGNA